MARSKGKPCPKGKRVRRQPQPLKLFKVGLEDSVFTDNLFDHVEAKAQVRAYPKYPYYSDVRKLERQYILRIFKEEGYKIKSVIGKGTMACVWRAIAPDGKKVAIKITKDLTDAAAFAAVLKKPPRTSLVPKVYCVGTIGFAKRRFYYIVMEQLCPLKGNIGQTSLIISELLKTYGPGGARRGRKIPERHAEALSWINRDAKEKRWGKEAKNIKTLIRGVVELYSLGFTVSDFHTGQFLFTKSGDIKIIDLGYSQHERLSPMTDLGCVMDPGVAYLEMVVADAVRKSNE